MTKKLSDKEIIKDAQRFVRRSDWSTQSPEIYDEALNRELKQEGFFAKCTRHMDLLSCPVLLDQDEQVW